MSFLLHPSAGRCSSQENDKRKYLWLSLTEDKVRKQPARGKLMGLCREQQLLRTGIQACHRSGDTKGPSATALWLRNSHPIWLGFIIYPTVSIAASPRFKFSPAILHPAAGKGTRTPPWITSNAEIKQIKPFLFHRLTWSHPGFRVWSVRERV